MNSIDVNDAADFCQAWSTQASDILLHSIALKETKTTSGTTICASECTTNDTVNDAILTKYDLRPLFQTVFDCDLVVFNMNRSVLLERIKQRLYEKSLVLLLADSNILYEHRLEMFEDTLRQLRENTLQPVGVQSSSLSFNDLVDKCVEFVCARLSQLSEKPNLTPMVRVKFYHKL